MTRAVIPLVWFAPSSFRYGRNHPSLKGVRWDPSLSPPSGATRRQKVTFACRDATALQLLSRSVVRPVYRSALCLAKTLTLLSKTRRTYRLFDLGAKSALLESVTRHGYTVSESDAGFLLIAGDSDISPKRAA